MIDSCSGVAQDEFHLGGTGGAERRHPATVRLVGIGSVSNESETSAPAATDRRSHDRNVPLARRRRDRKVPGFCVICVICVIQGIKPLQTNALRQ